MNQNRQQNNNQPIIVGVGASAGGLEAFRNLLGSLKEAPGLSLVYIQHLEPDSKSVLLELLRKSTSWEVLELKERTRLEAGRIYICPPQSLLEIRNGIVTPAEAESGSPIP